MIKLDSSTVIVGGIAIAGVWWYLANKRKLAARADAASGLLNPFDPDFWQGENFAYQGANQVGELVTGDEDFSYGSWLYDNRDNPLAVPITRTFDFVRWLRGD